MLAMESALLDPPFHRFAAQPRGQQLAQRDHSVLAPGDPGHLLLR
jgi:hypothetical protein